MDAEEVELTIKWQGDEYTVCLAADSSVSHLKRRLAGSYYRALMLQSCAGARSMRHASQSKPVPVLFRKHAT